MNESYWIPSDKVAVFQHEIAKLNRKAAKLDAPEIVITITGESKQRGFEWREISGKAELVSTDLSSASMVIDFHEVIVSGEAPKLNGWMLAATLQPVPELEANIVRAVPGVEIPVAYRTEMPKCDHCMTTRYRKTTFVVIHEDGDTKQVGSNCLADFTGSNDPHRAARMAEWVMSAFELADGMQTNLGGSAYDADISLHSFLAEVQKAITAHGWVSRTVARDQGSQATANRAMDNLFARSDLQRDPEMEAVTVDMDKIEAAITWAQDLSEDSNDYLWNLKVACSKPYMKHNESGIVASLLTAFARNGEKAERKRIREERGANSVHVGEVGKRQDFIVTLLGEPYAIEGYYGTTYLCNFADADGNEIKWFASNPPEMTPGETYTLKATVKKHDEYQGTKQTLITRAKLVETVAA